MSLETFVEAWNARDPDGIAAQFTPDGVRHQFALPEARLAGREAIAQAVGASLYAVPDATLDVRDQIVGQDGRVTFEWTWSGTHENDFPGLPASGALIRLPGVSITAAARRGAHEQGGADLHVRRRRTDRGGAGLLGHGDAHGGRRRPRLRRSSGLGSAQRDPGDGRYWARTSDPQLVEEDQGVDETS